MSQTGLASVHRMPSPRMRSDLPAGLSVQDGARAIFDGFKRYDINFRRITRQARARFESRDWAGGRQDLADRIDLWEKAVGRMVGVLERGLGTNMRDREFWEQMKNCYRERVLSVRDAAFARTFFSSVSRRVFGTVGVDPDVEFTPHGLEPTVDMPSAPGISNYLIWGALEDVIDEILTDYAFDSPYANRNVCVSSMCEQLAAYAQSQGRNAGELVRIELLEPVFFQSTRAYLVGRLHARSWSTPLAIALRHGEEGVAVDRVLAGEAELGALFGFTRSYFFVELDSVSCGVRYLRTLLPRKPVDELYTVLGRARQGKTERYRIFSRHLEDSQDRFRLAPGCPGLVMSVFTLPSYDLVFKVIRDRFGRPKTTTRSHVVEKYDMVFRHDRAGRLIDTQEFRRLEFSIDRFDEVTLAELLQSCSRTVHREGDFLVIDHVYVERRLCPLDIYVREAAEEDARAAVIDYGQAIKDLALTNIFAGDMLLKNFGVTNQNRVVLYDYDELAFLTECHFRRLPRTQGIEDDMRADPCFSRAENDVFPEQFKHFLGLEPALEETFLSRHTNLLDPAFWRSAQAMHDAGDIPDLLPYS
ncbi:MAG: bifunctional isocitrate dehydrogenase kinase/phosphatase [Gammaproteobacteria bacterium]